MVYTFRHLIEENGLLDKIEFKATFCMKQCSCDGVSVKLNDKGVQGRARGCTQILPRKRYTHSQGISSHAQTGVHKAVPERAFVPSLRK